MLNRKSLSARIVLSCIALTLCLLVEGIVLAETPQTAETPIERADDGHRHTMGQIPRLAVQSDKHVSASRNGIHFDAFFNDGPKLNVAIYTINTGRKQLVLSPEKHQAILEDLVRRKFTVIVADFREKHIPGIELERYVVRLTEDARTVVDGVRLPSTLRQSSAVNRQSAKPSRTETFANDYFTLMPGFTVLRDVPWFRYSDIPEPFRKDIARQLDRPFREEDGNATNTYDIIYPVYGPNVGVLTNYGSNEKGREDYYPHDTNHLVMSFAFKNLAIVHQQYFNDPVGGYHKGYDFYGDEFATAFIRHLKGNAVRYRIDAEKICCFGHSKGSEMPGMLVNKLRAQPPFAHGKANWRKVELSDQEKSIQSPFRGLSTGIACAILGAGVANNELRSDKMLPWNDEPTKNISPFFIFADHGELMRERTRELVAKAKEHGVHVESAELNSHTWPHGEAFDRASAFADKILRPEY